MLALTEVWISFSYYGMQSLLVLYMTAQLLRPGHVGHVLGFAGACSALGLPCGRRAVAPVATAIVGLYSALSWATPILGGVLADRLLGRTRTIILGAMLLSLGHLLMGFEASFLIALACLLAGMGCVGSIKAQLGGLYARADPRRADGFQIYSLAPAIAVVAAPLVCGTLGERIAWRWGFAAAACAMLLGTLVYLGGRRWLPADPRVHAAPGAARPKLSRTEWRRLGGLMLLLPVLGVASVGNMQTFDAYLLWAQRSYALDVFGHRIPVSWLLSLDALAAIPTTLLCMLFWRLYARRHGEADELSKMTAGAAILVLAPLLLALACWHAGGRRIGLGWAVGFHALNGLGFASLYAVGLALYSRASPQSLGATMVNAYALHLFLANLLAGWLGGLLDRLSGAQFWLLHAALIGLAALTLLTVALMSKNRWILKASP